jgi:hypothetical protein
MHWLYIWSPKFQLFHELLFPRLLDCSGIEPRPVFFPQSFFEQKDPNAVHYFQGNAIKIRLLLSALKKHPGEIVMVTDVDLVIAQTDGLYEYLESYSKNDMTFMSEWGKYNIGMMMIRSKPETIAFFESMIDPIEKGGAHDQTLLNEMIASYTGPHGAFSLPEVVLSNMVKPEDYDKYKIIQCITSLHGYENLMFERLITVSFFFDLTPYRHLIPKVTQKMLIDWAKTYDEINVITTWDEPEM